MRAVKVADNIWWVGAVDWDTRNFHGYSTSRGSTYNAYLIVDDKITLIDTVKAPFFPEMMARIAEIVDPAKIDIVISNHVEMDHSGALPLLMEKIPNAPVYTSPQGEKGLRAHYRKDWDFRVVKTGDALRTGRYSFSFVSTPMVHWPDNMLTYCPEAKILFSNDAFGEHLASAERFADEAALGIVEEEAAKYYANIVMPYGAQTQKALAGAGGLDIELIAPSHGLIWRRDIETIIGWYQKWSADRPENKAVVVYDSMWHSTEAMALRVGDALEHAGVPARMCNLKTTHISDIMTGVLMSRFVFVGSPTLNNGIMPTVAQFLTYLAGLAPKNRVGFAFGSYGWGGQSVGIIDKILRDAGMEVLDSVRLQYIPDEEQLRSLSEHVQKGLRPFLGANG
ncbi:MAG: flavodoxin domain-containing protein [Gracilibacteraceae bacterium]|jgi:flavorubredoxin|nr:flavodoxin domain-containing protein [Gracilibacteraceae bacterium]